MYRKLITAVSIVTMTLFLAPACAEQDKGTEASVKATTTDAVKSAPVTEAAKSVDGEQASVMDQPVDFSTPEAVEQSIEKVRQEAGDNAALKLTNALGYIKAYDLSVKGDKETMYKKLNGRTPNAIIAKMKR